VEAAFDGLVGDPEKLLAWHTIFTFMTMVIVARGVKSGLEQAVKLLMPALFVLLVVLVGYAMNTGAFSRAVDFLLAPRFDELTWRSVLDAMSQAFFSLSLGMGAIMAYGSYLSSDASIPRTTLTVAGMDTLVAILAGFAIFPLVFEYGLAPGQGPGLIFVTLPNAFAEMPFGTLVGTLFFVLLLFAGWTSAISIIEPAMAWMVENHGLTRVRAAMVGGIGVWAIGVVNLLSLNVWSGFSLFGMKVMDFLDFLTLSVMLPLGGAFIAFYAGWLLSRAVSMEELGMRGMGYQLWQLGARFVAPAAVLVVFVFGVYDKLTPAEPPPEAPPAAVEPAAPQGE
jgi:NSS family neurotransmitter:Na+ symporter